MWTHSWGGYLYFITFLNASEWNVTLELLFSPCYSKRRLTHVGLVASVHGGGVGGPVVASHWRYGGTHSRIFVHDGLLGIVLLLVLSWVLINWRLLINLKFLMHVRLLVAVVGLACSVVPTKVNFPFGLGRSMDVACNELVSTATEVVTLMKLRCLKDSCIVLINSWAPVKYLLL
jgi:hypothetical protein